MDLFSEAAHDLAARIAASAAAGRPVQPAHQLNRRSEAPASGEGAAVYDTAFRLGGSGAAGTFDPGRPVASLDQLYSQARTPCLPLHPPTRRRSQPSTLRRPTPSSSLLLLLLLLLLR
jgi:hypothetical protein